MMALPPFASFPPANIRSEIPPEEWQGCLESWVLLAKSNLLLSSEEFSLQITKDPSIVKFLLSYIRQNAATKEDPTSRIFPPPPSNSHGSQTCFDGSSGMGVLRGFRYNLSFEQEPDGTS